MSNDLDQRASHDEREAAVTRLQEAYTHGQLQDTELEDRIERALGAQLKSQLEGLTRDLPAVVRPSSASARRVPSKQNVWKSNFSETGAWAVPSRLEYNLYKGTLVLDMRQAILETSAVQIQIQAYKSTLEIIVPPGWTVEGHGLAYQGRWENSTRGGAGPRVELQGNTYKSSVIIREEN